MNTLEKNQTLQAVLTNQLTIVDFYTEWCAPCKMIAPMLEKVAIDKKEQLEVLKVDAEIHLQAAEDYAILSVPTLLLFKNKEVVAKHTGFMSEAMLLQWIHPYL